VNFNCHLFICYPISVSFDIAAEMGCILGCQSLKTKFNFLNNLLPPELHNLNVLGWEKNFIKRRTR
jgi:hypothetical protein